LSWADKITAFGQMLNDLLGCCTIAGCGHAVQTWTVNLGAEVTVPDSVIEKYYQDWDGYVPGDPSTDQGGVEMDVIAKWKAQTFDGHRLLSSVDVNLNNQDEVRTAIMLFGGIYIGVSLPLTAQTQNLWDVAGATDGSNPSAAPGSWGGHCVFVLGYNEIGPICVTWGQLKQMTWAFWLAYCDEAHVLLSADWVVNNVNPDHVDLDQLQQDEAALAA
jgi:hypothetical protein